MLADFQKMRADFNSASVDVQDNVCGRDVTRGRADALQSKLKCHHPSPTWGKCHAWSRPGSRMLRSAARPHTADASRGVSTRQMRGVSLGFSVGFTVGVITISERTIGNSQDIFDFLF